MFICFMHRLLEIWGMHTIMHNKSSANLHYFIKLCKRLQKKNIKYYFLYVLQHKISDNACAREKKIVLVEAILCVAGLNIYGNNKK